MGTYGPTTVVAAAAVVVVVVAAAAAALALVLAEVRFCPPTLHRWLVRLQLNT